MRRITAILLAALLLLSFCGCAYAAYDDVSNGAETSFLDKLRESDTQADTTDDSAEEGEEYLAEETKPDTTVVETTDAPDTTAAETTTAPDTTTLPETTEVPEATAAETTSSRDIPYAENYHGHVYTGGEKSTKYHYEAGCAGKYSHEISWEEVDSSGLEPCKKCVLK